MIPALDPSALPPSGDHPSAGSGDGHAVGSGLDTGSSATAPGSILGSPPHRQAAGFGCYPPQSPAASPLIGPFGPLFHPMSPGGSGSGGRLEQQCTWPPDQLVFSVPIGAAARLTG
jgi:hypothetical protein